MSESDKLINAEIALCLKHRRATYFKWREEVAEGKRNPSDLLEFELWSGLYTQPVYDNNHKEISQD